MAAPRIEDDAASGQSRLLLRLWLAVPNSRALPDGFDVLWGDIAPGAVRGGVVQADGRRGLVSDRHEKRESQRDCASPREADTPSNPKDQPSIA